MRIVEESDTKCGSAIATAVASIVDGSDVV